MANAPDIETGFERALRAFLRKQRRQPAEDCPESALISAYYEQTLDEGAVRTIDDHLVACIDCQAELAMLARLDTDAPAAETPAAAVVIEEPPPPPAKAAPIVVAPAAEPEPEPEVPPAPIFAPRSRWAWVGPAALAATAMIAISVTYRYAPMMEEASRRAADGVQSQPQVQPQIEPPSQPPAKPVEPQAPPGGDVEARDKSASAAPARPAEPAPAAPAPEPAPQPMPQPPTVELGDQVGATGGLAKQDEGAAQNAAPPPEPEFLRGAREREEKELAAKLARGETPFPPEPTRKKQALADETAPAAGAAAPEPPAAARDRLSLTARGGAPSTEGSADTSPKVEQVVLSRTNPAVRWRLAAKTIERSDDGGKTWQPQQARVRATLLAGSAPSAEVCWATGKNGTVMRTTDGQRWEMLESPTTDDLIQVTAWNESSATVKSVSGEQFSTTDGGVTWSKL